MPTEYSKRRAFTILFIHNNENSTVYNSGVIFIDSLDAHAYGKDYIANDPIHAYRAYTVLPVEIFTPVKKEELQAIQDDTLDDHSVDDLDPFADMLDEVLGQP